jgi:hypothetical protein
MWKHIMCLVMIQWKYVQTQTRMKVDHRIKDIKVVYKCVLSSKLSQNIFCHEFFLCLCMHIIFLLHWGLHSFKVLYNNWCSFHDVCITWKETIERINGPKKEKKHVFDVLPMYIFLVF